MIRTRLDSHPRIDEMQGQLRAELRQNGFELVRSGYQRQHGILSLSSHGPDGPFGFHPPAVITTGEQLRNRCSDGGRKFRASDGPGGPIVDDGGKIPPCGFASDVHQLTRLQGGPGVDHEDSGRGVLDEHKFRGFILDDARN